MSTSIYDQIVILPGMPRTGTSYLYHVLQKHPDLFLPHRKETSFFCSNFDKGKLWYEDFFNTIQSHELGLDISPLYFMHQESLLRIKEFNPDAKIILCVRRPSDWILSWYSQLSSHELHMPPFDEFIKSHRFKPSIGHSFQINLQNDFITNSINSYCKTFGHNLLIYHYDLFKKKPLLVLQSIEKFLELPEYFNQKNVENIIINAGNRKHIWLVSYLLSRASIVHLLEFCIPRKKLQQIRNHVDKASTPQKGFNTKIYSENNIALAKKTFSTDDAFVKSFFSSNPIQLGYRQTFI